MLGIFQLAEWESAKHCKSTKLPRQCFSLDAYLQSNRQVPVHGVDLTYSESYLCTASTCICIYCIIFCLFLSIIWIHLDQFGCPSILDMQMNRNFECDCPEQMGAFNRRWLCPLCEPGRETGIWTGSSSRVNKNANITWSLMAHCQPPQNWDGMGWCFLIHFLISHAFKC